MAGKHPFPDAQLRDLSENGQWLVQQIAPTNALAAPEGADPAALVRDQLWTLLSDRYDAFRSAVAVVVGLAELDARLPPLGARVAGARNVTTIPGTATPPETPRRLVSTRKPDGFRRDRGPGSAVVRSRTPVR